MLEHVSRFIAAAALVALSGTAIAAPVAASAPVAPVAITAPSPGPLPADVFAKSHWMALTRADYDAALAKLPENLHWEFATSPKRIQDLLNGLLLNKTLAAQARAHGLGGDAFASKPAGDAERALANAELKRIADASGDAFDAKKAEYEARARERYMIDRDKYRRPEQVRFSDIAVAIEGRGDAAAQQRVEEARQRLLAGADFATVAREYSDDPKAKENGGAMPWVSAKQLAPEFAKGVFALTKIGEISAPIKGPAAWHVVRLDERKPGGIQRFEDVRDAIMKDLRDRYIAQQRELRIQAIYGDPDLQINQPAIDALVNRVDPESLTPAAAKSAAPASQPGSPAPAGRAPVSATPSATQVPPPAAGRN
ncbi:MAG TPA: peptidylprolyl isomerase [Casimicrobiaceae bacterium]|nr:peptidylprolyl isomerase [Casimicrobiaceae bacterium]